jgi:hypothetical protein
MLGANGSRGLNLIYVGRVIAGMGIGCASNLTPIYISEACRFRSGIVDGLNPVFVCRSLLLLFVVALSACMRLAGSPVD